MNNILKYISFILVTSILFIVTSLPAFAVTEDLNPLDPPTDSYPVTGTDHFMWYLNSKTGYTAPDLEQYQFTTVLSLDSLSNTNYTWCYPFTNIEDSTGSDIIFSKDCTYVLQLSFNQGPFYSFQGTLGNFNPRLSTGSNMYLQDTYDLGDYVKDNSISTTVVTNSNLVTINLIFHMSDQPEVPCYYVAPFLYFTGSSIVYLKYTGVTGYYDPDFSIYQMLLSSQIDAVKQSIYDAANQAHEDSLKEQDWLEQIQQAISEGTADHPNTGSSDELADLEGDLISDVSTITLPDGSTVSASGNVFEQLDSWLQSEYSPVEFDEDAASIVSELFDTFMPYVGIVIFLNLTLALGISFLSGRRAGT